MSTRTKLVLFLAAALVLGGILWVPQLLRSGGDVSGDGALPVSGAETEVGAQGLEVGEASTLPDGANAETEHRTEVVRLGSIRGVFARAGEPLRSIRVILRQWNRPDVTMEELEEMMLEVNRGGLLLETLEDLYSGVGTPVETREAVTDARGGFLFAELPVGDYELTAELEKNAEFTRGSMPLESGETLDLGELRVPVESVDRTDLVRIRVHAYDHDGPVSGLQVNVRSEGQLLSPPYLLDDFFESMTDPEGRQTLVLEGDDPISIDLVDGDGRVVGGTGREQVYAKGKLHEVWISVEKGHLVATLPQPIELARGHALQYVVESSLLSRETIRSSTIRGGVDPPAKAGVEHIPKGCKFLDLPAGACTVKATLLKKNEKGVWQPSGVRFRGSATVVGGNTVTCALWRN